MLLLLLLFGLVVDLMEWVDDVFDVICGGRDGFDEPF